MRVELPSVNSTNIVKDIPVNIGPSSGSSVVRDSPEQPAVQNDFRLNNEKQRLDEAVQQANKALEGSGRYFKYEVHEATNQVVISVMDEKTNEVVREIPAKKLLDIVAKFMELAGLMIDERR